MLIVEEDVSDCAGVVVMLTAVEDCSDCAGSALVGVAEMVGSVPVELPLLGVVWRPQLAAAPDKAVP